jgi:hypothetical protein
MKRFLTSFLLALSFSAFTFSQVTSSVLDDFENGTVNFTAVVNVNPTSNMSQAVVANPLIDGTNGTTNAWQWTRLDAGAANNQVWAGFWANLTTPIDANTTSITVKFYRTNANSTLKIHCQGTWGSKEFLPVAAPTLINQWETLTFDLNSNGVTGLTTTVFGLQPDYPIDGTTIDLGAVSYVDQITLLSDAALLAPVKTAQWKFNNSSNLLQATVGADLILNGSITPVPGPSFNDGAIQIGAGSNFLATHGITGTGTAGVVNQFTMMYDIYLPTATWKSLYQNNLANNVDARCFIKPTGEIGIGSTGYSTYQLPLNQWHRVVVAVQLGTSYKYYVDGTLVKDGTSQSLNGVYSLAASQVLLFGDNDGDDGLINVSEVDIWNKALSDAQVLALGSVPVVSNTVLMDFGDPGASYKSASPWNNVSNELTSKAATALTDDLGNSTGYSLTTTSNFQAGYNTSGTTSPAGDAATIFPATATKDNFYIGINWGSPTANITSAGFDLSGLDPSKYYSFSIFGSRAGVGDVRSAKFSFTGDISTGTGITTQNASNNTSNVAYVYNIKPTSSGVISFTMQANTDNNNGNKFAYLGAIKMTNSGTPVVTGIDNQINSGLTKVYYSNGYIHLNDFTGIVKVFGVDGKLVKEGNAIFGYLPVQLAKGLYIVNTTQGSSKLIIK